MRRTINDAAEKRCRRLLREYPEVFDGHQRLAMLREAQGRFRETAEHYAKLLKMMRKDPQGLDPEMIGFFTEQRDQALAKARERRSGSHGSTYGGNPLASAVGMAALDVLVDEKLVERGVELGGYFRKKLDTLKHPKIKEVRNKGMLLAVEFTAPPAKPFCKEMMKGGVLAKDTHDVTARFAPPLVITKEQIDEAFAVAEKALAALAAKETLA